MGLFTQNGLLSTTILTPSKLFTDGGLFNQGGDPTLALGLNLCSPALDPRVTFSRASAATHIVGGQVVSVASGAPRISVENGLLIEEQRTNLLTYSKNIFGNWGEYSCTKTASPDTFLGYFTDGATVSSSLYYGGVTRVFSSTAGQACCITLFVKNSSNGKIFIGLGASDIRGNLGSELSVTYNNAGNTYGTITSTSFFGGYRIIIPVTFASTGSPELRVGPDGGSGTATIDVFGAQVEDGAFPTSYIPTTTAAVTRAADVASVNMSSTYNDAEGTVFVDFTTQSLTAAASPGRVVMVGDLGNYNISILAYDVAIKGEVIRAGAAEASLVPYTPSAYTSYKAALAYKLNDFAMAVGGGAPFTDTTGTPPTLTVKTAFLGNTNVGNRAVNGYLRRLNYYNVRKTNAELQEMTS